MGSRVAEDRLHPSPSSLSEALSHEHGCFRPKPGIRRVASEGLRCVRTQNEYLLDGWARPLEFSLSIVFGLRRSVTLAERFRDCS